MMISCNDDGDDVYQQVVAANALTPSPLPNSSSDVDQDQSDIQPPPLHSTPRDQDKFDSRWEDGIWLGIRDERGETAIGAKEGVIKARTIRRKASEEERLRDELFDEFKGAPLATGTRTSRRSNYN